MGQAFGTCIGGLPTHIDKILKGAKPADMAVQTPWEFEFVINLRTAQKLGLTIPASPSLFQAMR